MDRAAPTVGKKAVALKEGEAAECDVGVEVTALAEIALALWLLVMGINEPRWREQARAAGYPA